MFEWVSSGDLSLVEKVWICVCMLWFDQITIEYFCSHILVFTAIFRPIFNLIIDYLTILVPFSGSTILLNRPSVVVSGEFSIRPSRPPFDFSLIFCKFFHLNRPPIDSPENSGLDHLDHRSIFRTTSWSSPFLYKRLKCPMRHQFVFGALKWYIWRKPNKGFNLIGLSIEEVYRYFWILSAIFFWGGFHWLDFDRLAFIATGMKVIWNYFSFSIMQSTIFCLLIFINL